MAVLSRLDAPNIHSLAVFARIRRPCACSTSHNPSPGLPPSIQQGLRRLADGTAASPLSRPPITRVLVSAREPLPHPRQLPARCHRHRHRPHAQPCRAPLLHVPLQALRRSPSRGKSRPFWMGRVGCTTHRRVRPSAGGDVGSETKLNRREYLALLLFRHRIISTNRTSKQFRRGSVNRIYASSIIIP